MHKILTKTICRPRNALSIRKFSISSSDKIVFLFNEKYRNATVTVFAKKINGYQLYHNQRTYSNGIHLMQSIILFIYLFSSIKSFNL